MVRSLDLVQQRQPKVRVPDVARPVDLLALGRAVAARPWSFRVQVHRRHDAELRVPLHWVTPKVLTETLRAMERGGFVSRTECDENPPRVEYELTELGRRSTRCTRRATGRGRTCPNRSRPGKLTRAPGGRGGIAVPRRKPRVATA
jgi:hypothetical protein